MNNKRLKSYVRLDASGRPIQGSIILRLNMPKVGRWQLVPSAECCIDNSLAK